jgi:DNA ligase (NAD+)
MINSKDDYESTVQTLNQAAAKYYAGVDSGMSDSEFDAEVIELRKWEAENPSSILPTSPTQAVLEGNVPVDGIKVKHVVPMLSLLDYFDMDTFTKWWTAQKETLFVVEHKIDGLSVEVVYKDGKLEQASTRGNGYEGEDVTQAVLGIQGIPNTIAFNGILVVRGEIYMTYQAFDDYVQLEGPAKNARNLAVGLLKRKDGGLAASKYLSGFFFNVQQYSGPKLEHHSESLRLLSELGLPVVKHALCHGLAAVTTAIEGIEKERASLPYQIDGAVIKYNNLDRRQEVGDTGAVPRWAVAYKYPAISAETEVLDITFQLGKSGKLTPVANLEPVFLDGSTISRCTLHNLNRMRELDIRVGDIVTLHKSGDIIPKITKSRHTSKSQEFHYAEECPVCKTKLEGEYCPNDTCPNITESKLYNWVDKGGLDAKGVAGSLVSELISRKMITTPADFYKLKPTDLYRLPKMGATKVTKTLKAIDETRTRPFSRVIVALCINQVGGSASDKLANYALTWDGLLNLTLAECHRLVGNSVGTNFYNAMQKDYYKDLIAELKTIFTNFN